MTRLFASAVLLRALVLPLALVGCNTVQDPMSTSSAPSPAPPASGEVASDLALASLSGLAPAVLGVRQTPTADGLEQRIVLDDDTRDAGENMLTLQIGRASARDLKAAPTRAAILQEMRAALPDAAMVIGGDARSNAHGPYGYATGRTAAGATCVYAWQLARDIDASRARSGYAAMVRLRYCEAGSAGADLAGLMATLRIKLVDGQTLALLRMSTRSALATQPLAYAPPAVSPAPVGATARRDKQPSRPEADAVTVLVPAPTASHPSAAPSVSPVAVPMPD